MNNSVPQPLMNYLLAKKEWLIYELEMVKALIGEQETPVAVSSPESEKIDWEKEIIKVIWEKGGIAGKGEIINALKGRIRTDIQTLKNEVSAALVLNSNKTFRRQKVDRSFKYTLAIKQPAI